MLLVVLVNLSRYVLCFSGCVEEKKVCVHFAADYLLDNVLVNSFLIIFYDSYLE